MSAVGIESAMAPPVGGPVPLGQPGPEGETDEDMLPGRKPISDLKKMLDDFRMTNSTNRLQGLVDYDYYDGKQLTSTELSKLAERGQPDVFTNRLRVAINGILGIVARSHTDPKAWPRNPGDDDSSNVATLVLKYIAQKRRLSQMKTQLLKDSIIGGSCAVLVGVDANGDVSLQKIRWEEFIYDPRSRELDFSDARYLGIAKWMYVDDVTAVYTEAKIDLENTTLGATASIGASDESFADRPVNQGWIDLRNKRVMTVEMYYRYGSIWYKSVFYYGGVLEEGKSPYLDSYGKPTCPIEASSCYIDRDNNRYGLCRDMRPLQDEINKRRSKLLNIVNNSQIQARDPSAIEVDAQAARLEAARPDGVIPYGWEKVPLTDMAQGQSLLLQEAKAEIERFAPNPAVLGRQGADTSGRAMQARQQAGLIELAVVLDQHDDLELRIYKAMWARAQQYMTDPAFIRITDDQDTPKFVRINEPVPPGSATTLDSNEQPMVEGQPEPAAGQEALGYKNNIAEMDVDIVIDTTPSTATIMQEQFKDLMDLVASNPLYAQQVPFDMMVEMMPGLPNKRQIVQKLTAYRKQKEQAQQQTESEQHDIVIGTGKAKIADMASKAQLNTANAGKATLEGQARVKQTEVNANTAAMEATIAHDASNQQRYKHIADTVLKAVELDNDQNSSGE